MSLIWGYNQRTSTKRGKPGQLQKVKRTPQKQGYWYCIILESHRPSRAQKFKCGTLICQDLEVRLVVSNIKPIVGDGSNPSWDIHSLGRLVGGFKDDWIAGGANDGGGVLNNFSSFRRWVDILIKDAWLGAISSRRGQVKFKGFNTYSLTTFNSYLMGSVLEIV